MAWNEFTLSTTESLKRHQINITSQSNYTADQWAAKFEVSKQMMANDIIARMGTAQYLDYITNTSSLCLASDYLTLSLVYLNLSQTGLYEIYEKKKFDYAYLYEHQLKTAITSLQFSNRTSMISSGILQI